MTKPQHKNACSGGNSIFKYGKPFLSHHCYTLNLCDLCLSEEKKIIKTIIHFHYVNYLATPLYKNPCTGGHEIYNFGGQFLGNHYFIHSLSDVCLGVEKIFIEK